MAGQYEFASQEELINSITFRDGKIFVSDQEIPVAMKGEPGLMGKRGLTGDPPKHEWDGTKIRIQNPDKTWGPWVDLKGKPGKNGTDGKNGLDGADGRTPQKGIDYVDGENGVDGRRGKEGASIRGERGIDGENGNDGQDGRPGVEPEEMLEIRTNLFNMKEAIDLMAERVSNVKDGRDGQDGKDGKNGKDGTSVQGPAGRQGESGEPGIPPHDWNVTLNNVAVLMQKMESVVMEFRNSGVEI